MKPTGMGKLLAAMFCFMVLGGAGPCAPDRLPGQSAQEDGAIPSRDGGTTTALDLGKPSDSAGPDLAVSVDASFLSTVVFSVPADLVQPVDLTTHPDLAPLSCDWPQIKNVSYSNYCHPSNAPATQCEQYSYDPAGHCCQFISNVPNYTPCDPGVND